MPDMEALFQTCDMDGEPAGGPLPMVSIKKCRIRRTSLVTGFVTSTPWRNIDNCDDFMLIVDLLNKEHDGILRHELDCRG